MLVKKAGKAAGRKVLTEVGKKAATRAEKEVMRKLLTRAEKQAQASYGKWIAAALRKAGKDFPKRFGTEAKQVLEKRLRARVGGLVLDGIDRSSEYEKLVRAGDLEGLENLASELAKSAALNYANSVGYEVFHAGGKAGQAITGPRLGAVHSDGKRFKVVVPSRQKGRLGAAIERGKDVLEAVKDLAEEVQKRSDKPDERLAAREVLAAAREGRLDVEVLHVKQHRGKVTGVRVEHEVGAGADLLREVTSGAGGLLREVPGAWVAWLRQRTDSIKSATLQDAIRQAQPMTRALKLELWAVGGHPMALRPAISSGEMIQPARGLLGKETDGVGDVAVALMEWAGRFPAVRRGPIDEHTTGCQGSTLGPGCGSGNGTARIAGAVGRLLAHRHPCASECRQDHLAGVSVRPS
jgi:hypothetical protein